MASADDEDDWQHESDEDPSLGLVRRFLLTAKTMQWFAAVGQPFDRPLREAARDYLDALGFPGAGIAPVDTWADAADAAETRDFDDPAFEAEEQLRAALTEEAVDMVGEEALEVISTLVAAELGDRIGEAALNAMKIWGKRDRDLVNAAAGAGLAACHQAVLLLVAGRAEEDHPFALKFKLFEAGRWPVGLAGASFHLF